MKKVSRIVASAIVSGSILTGCSSRPDTYTVEGTLLDSSRDGKYLYLYSYDQGENIDSAIVTDQHFVFTGTAAIPELVRIDVNQTTFANLFLENGTITVDFGTRLGSPSTPLNKEFANLMNEQEQFRTKSMEAYNQFATETDDPEAQTRKREELSEKMEKEYLTLLRSYFERNNDNALGAQVLSEYAYSAKPDEVDELIAIAGPNVLAMNMVKELKKRNEVLKNTAEGMPFSDFTIQTEDGDSVSLSDYVGKGKYVLVDFWASWCGPCIQETPVLREVYDKYKDKGFELLGVAVWDRPEDTKRAIGQHEITWPQIINAQTVPTDLYGIAGIPHIILFGPDGKIVKRDLRGDGLKKAVKEAME